MRVKCPLPWALNQSTISLSSRRCTEVLPRGITTRARFQKSSPRNSASGASARVASSPRARLALISLREYLTVVSFSLMSVRPLRGDDPKDILAAPCVNDPVDLHVDAPESDEPKLAVISAIIDPLDDLVGKHQSGSQKR